VLLFFKVCVYVSLKANRSVQKISWNNVFDEIVDDLLKFVKYVGDIV